MASARPPGGSSVPQARLGLDISAFTAAPAAVAQAMRATAREASNALKSLRAEQKLAQTQANTTLAEIKAQQTQITATTKAESQVRIAAARAEGAAQAQVARAAAATTIEEERRKTAAFRSELRAREQANRQSQVSSGGFGQGAATFAGAALGGPIGGLAGAVAGGSPALAAGLLVSEAARFAIDADKLATAYGRQRIAAENLAGSQAKLNVLLQAYGRATGGAVSEADALTAVTKLMAVGFADDAQEAEKFARAIRGIALAMGTSQDYVTQNLILELFSQRGMRLDQLGLQYDKVRERADQLAAADSNLTAQQAYQNAVLEQAEERFGRLADTLEGQATGAERATKAWQDLRLELAQELKPNVDQAGNDFADLLGWINRVREANQSLQRESVQSRMQQEGSAVGLPSLLPSAANRSGNAPYTPFRSAAPDRFGGEQGQAQLALIIERESAIQQITRDSNEAILDSERQYGQQRASTVANYEKSRTREQEDFGRQRANAERKLQLSILDVAQDSARQRVKWEADLARTIATAQANTAERLADMQAEHERTTGERRADSDERMAEARADSAERLAEAQIELNERTSKERADSAERLAEIEKQYQEERETSLRSHTDTLHSAAARFDAKAIFDERKRWERENQEQLKGHAQAVEQEGKRLTEFEQEQEDAHAKAITQERKNLQERLDDERKSFDKANRQANEAYARQVADQQKALDKQITQANETHARQLADQAENDRLRIQEMRDAFADQTAQENTERAIRLSRQAEDHAAQLAEMAAAQGLRIAQIQENAAEERDQLDKEFQKALDEAGLRTTAYTEMLQRREDAAIKAFDKWWAHVNDEMEKEVPPTLGGEDSRPPGFARGGYVGETGMARVHAGEYVLSRAMLAGAAPVAPAVSQAVSNSSNSTSLTVAPGAIVVYAAPGQSATDIGAEVEARLADILRGMNPGGYYS